MRILNINPRKPIESGFGLHIRILKYCGLWPFLDTDDEKKLLYYNLYGSALVMLFLVIFVITQIAYMALYVDSIKTFADALYFLLIQGVTLPKNLFLRRHIYRIKSCMDKLETDQYLPQNEREDEYVGSAIKINLILHRFGIFMCFLCIFSWMLTVVTGEKPTLVPAAFPFEYEHGFGFYFVFVFQFMGTVYSAVTYLTADTLFIGFLFHATAQIHRLCGRLERLGYEDQDDNWAVKNDGVIPVKPRDEQQELYDQLVECIKHHRDILGICSEMQRCFSEVTFIQLCVSLFTLCMTEFLLMMFKDDHVFFFNILPYFFTISFQMWELNFAGNEVYYASQNLMSHAYFSNFVKMDVRARKLLITFMEKLKYDVIIVVGILFETPISIDTFVRIMKSSYSYFAVLQTMQDK